MSIITYHSRLTGAYYYINYNKDNASNEPVTGKEGIANAGMIRDYLRNVLGWRPNQVVGAVASAHWYARMNPAKGFGVPDATMGGYWQKDTRALYNVWRSAYGDDKYQYGDAPLMLMRGHVAENAGFNYTGIRGDAPLTFRSYLATSNMTVGDAFFYFYHGYVFSGITSMLITEEQCNQQARYWYGVLYNGQDDGEGDPDLPPAPLPEEGDAKKDYIWKHVVIPLIFSGKCANISGRKTYLRGDCT